MIPDLPKHFLEPFNFPKTSLISLTPLAATLDPRDHLHLAAHPKMALYPVSTPCTSLLKPPSVTPQAPSSGLYLQHHLPPLPSPSLHLLLRAPDGKVGWKVEVVSWG